MTEIVDYGSRRNKLITARRALDTSDLDDFMFQLDKEMVLAFSYSIDSSQYSHDESFTKESTLLLLSDG